MTFYYSDPMKLQGSNILVKPEKKIKTFGGIHLTPSAQKSPIGMVLDTGPGCEEVKIGDRIHYTPKKAHIVEIEGQELHFIPEGDIAYIY